MTLVKFRNGRGITDLPVIERNFSFPSFFTDTLDKLWADDNMSWMPAVNVTERAEDFKIDLAVPGMDKKDFQVEVEKGVLMVSGERKEDVVNDDNKISRREFHYGAFKRSFNLPDSADSENVNASYKDGILTLLIAKKEDSKQKPKKLISIQ
ncbi:MAG: Hsp20/alpha crystallin family protein [Bacteroidia bacterium]|jgi:HSP20 family protein|nr:Hsp20/alpha crystallin family protein [Bacteroidia bacterium]